MTFAKGEFRSRDPEKGQRTNAFRAKTTRKLVYAETDDFKLVKIPYDDEKFYMLVVPPKRAENIGECCRQREMKKDAHRTTPAT